MGSWLDDKFGQEFQEEIAQWVHDNYDIDDLYTDKEIRNWLEENAKEYDYEMSEQENDNGKI